MKILHITPSYKPAYIYGGPIQSVGKLCEALAVTGKQKIAETKYSADGTFGDNANENINIAVLTTTANGKTELNVPIGKPVLVEGVSVTYFRRWTKDHSHFSPALLLQLRKEIISSKNNQHLIIHIHAWWNLVSILVCLIAKWYNVPIVLSPRGMLSTYSQHNRSSFAKKWMHRLIGKSLLRYCYIHATSEQEKSEAIEIAMSKGAVVIPNLLSSNNEHFNIDQIKKKQDDNSRFEIIFLSRIEQKKGLELLFQALFSIDVPWHLTIAGSGEQDYVGCLKQKAKGLMLADRITWNGQVRDNDKFQLMARHDLFVLTSYNENFANVVIESLDIGTPVLISNEVGLADYVADKDFGWVCRLTVEDIKAKILLAFNDNEKRARIRVNAPDLIKQDFSDALLVERYLQLYKEVALNRYES
ncbi:XrtY-associated glycosyltransferase XYAG1 [Pedobacter miscanthi]|uniref:Glycosyltransferase n=1 Tax=Pedobacter miscanthi TaxID=2259170 RepID=A0A366L7Y8_9SPHI|nr:glycosyltransferase [Pedobacter miscanthi]RBQ09995.1 hypothetical protein DRW42_06035 [Pedobacter miscanthi]